MNKRPVQYFSQEYLQSCKSMTPLQILEYEENFRALLALQTKENEQIYVDGSLLHLFKKKASVCNIDYHAQLEKLMKEWIEKTDS